MWPGLDAETCYAWRIKIEIIFAKEVWENKETIMRIKFSSLAGLIDYKSKGADPKEVLFVRADFINSS